MRNRCVCEDYTVYKQYIVDSEWQCGRVLSVRRGVVVRVRG